MVNSGIYCIRNIVSGRVYVGSAVNISKRWTLHRSLLNLGKHHSPALRRSWLKHGKDAFVFEIVEIVEAKASLIEREQHWIDTFNSACPKTGFNVAPKAGSRLGTKHSLESLAKMRRPRKNKPPPFTQEHRAAISASKMGHSWNKGSPKSIEHRRKQSEVMKGRKMPWIAESNKKRRGQKIGPMSEEAKQKLRARIVSVETRMLMSIAAKARCARQQQGEWS